MDNAPTAGMEPAKWEGKCVALVAHNFEFAPDDPEHPINWLHARGAKVFIVIRSTASTLHLYKDHPRVAGLLIVDGKQNVANSIRTLRADRFDVAILYLSLPHLERYIPHIAAFYFLRAKRKLVFRRNENKLEQMPMRQFVKSLTQNLLQYRRMALIWPVVALHNTLRAGKPFTSIRRILLIRLDYIGDALMASTLIDSLQATFPGATIDMLVSTSNAGLFSHDERIRNLIIFKSSWHTRENTPGSGASRSLHEFTKTIKLRLRKENYDIAVDSRGDFFDSWAAYESGARYVVGTVSFYYNTAAISNKLFLSHPVQYGNELHPAHEQYEKIARALGYVGPALQPRVVWNEDDERNIIELLQAIPHTAKKIALHLWSRDATRRWPADNFKEVIRMVVSIHPDSHFLLLGSPGEYLLNEEFAEGLLHDGVKMHNIAGKTTLLESAALLSKMDMFVGNDSGPMHLAAAAGTRVVGLFLPLFARIHSPAGSQHRILSAPEEGTIASIPPEAVSAAVLEVIRS